MAKISMTPKRWLLWLHLMFSGILLGVSVCFLILSITAAATRDPDVLKSCYTVMHILSKSSLRASTIGAVVTGILLSVLTHWGLFRYYWIILKEMLTLGSIGLGIIGIYAWSLQGLQLVDEPLSALQTESLHVNEKWLLTGIALQIASLAAMFILSVFKPWGKRRTQK